MHILVVFYHVICFLATVCMSIFFFTFYFLKHVPFCTCRRKLVQGYVFLGENYFLGKRFCKRKLGNAVLLSINR